MVATLSHNNKKNQHISANVSLNFERMTITTMEWPAILWQTRKITMIAAAIMVFGHGAINVYLYAFC